jgi:hypothetical protein
MCKSQILYLQFVIHNPLENILNLIALKIKMESKFDRKVSDIHHFLYSSDPDSRESSWKYLP